MKLNLTSAKNDTLTNDTQVGWLNMPAFGSGYLEFISRDLAERLGPLAPKPLPHMVRKYSGDLAIFGKGELLITA